ncbi:MAG TPA: DUF3097 domain-containing protein [Jatrophihabitantaceae bacterium]
MRYDSDVLAQPPSRRRAVPEIAAEPDLVVETADGRFCGAVVGISRAVDAGERRDVVVLEDRHGRRREFAMLPAAFLLDGRPVTLVRPAVVSTPAPPRKTASGSFAVDDAPARVARASRIWVEGVHDAALVERIWGDDLRVEAVVVEPLDGIDALVERLRAFGPGPQRRVGVLADHLVAGSKESRIAEQAQRSPHVLVTGHPYVDIWQAVKPTALGIAAWPDVPRGTDWKTGVCAALRVGDPRDMWRRVLASVHSYADVEVPLLRAVEELIDFVTDSRMGESHREVSL